MSDTSLGDGWWLSADGKWYPPDATPGPGRGSAQPDLAAPSSSVVSTSDPSPRPATAPAAQQNTPGGLISLLGWVVVIAGIGVIIAIIAELSSNENEFLELNFGDYLIAMSPGMIVIGVGATTAALGGLLNRIAPS